MPIDFQIFPERGIVFFRMVGTVDTTNSVDAFLAYTDHPDFDPSFVFLTDTTHLSHMKSDFVRIVGAVQRTMRLFSRFKKGSLCIIHAPGDVNFGMARILQQVLEPVSSFQVKVTRSDKDALTLAGQPELSFPELERALGLPATTD
ncbi:hypothetical protein [Antarctobacter jejuensis]|uniref:hypothetical protein n=1 Tax=Antarctobacter jejuensis TaxID=1439938 RepID=UPI003FD42EC3